MNKMIIGVALLGSFLLSGGVFEIKASGDEVAADKEVVVGQKGVDAFLQHRSEIITKYLDDEKYNKDREGYLKANEELLQKDYDRLENKLKIAPNDERVKDELKKLDEQVKIFDPKCEWGLSKKIEE